MFDYYEGKINNHNRVNLIIEDGSFATPEEIKKRKNEYAKYIENSNLWQGVISFNNDYINENISLKDLEKIVSTKVIPKFLRKCGFNDIKNISYQIALHTNTDNYHFHFSFIEKKESYSDSNGKISYRKLGKINKQDINYLKNELVLEIEREKYFTPKLTNINKDIEELKKYFNPKEKNFILRNIDDLIIEENILTLGKLITDKRNGKKGRIKFNSIYDKDIKELTKNIKNYLFKNNNSDLYNCESVFNNDLDNLNNYLYNINKENNIKSKRQNAIIHEKKDYIDNYIYNAIINHSSYLYGKLREDKKYIKAEDIIQEAILKQYKKNIKQNRFTVIKNYLSSKIPSAQFPNKYKIEQTIKKLNNEIEEAKTEFSKLFNDEYEL